MNRAESGSPALRIMTTGFILLAAAWVFLWLKFIDEKKQQAAREDAQGYEALHLPKGGVLTFPPGEYEVRKRGIK